MLPNHSPLVIAEQFGTLESIYPGRIDLGLGRAPGTDPATSYALRRGLDQTGHDFPQLLQELQSYLGEAKADPARQSLSGQRSECADLVARVERLQRPAIGLTRSALCFCQSLCTGRIAPLTQNLSTDIQALRSFAGTLRHDWCAGGRRRNR